MNKETAIRLIKSKFNLHLSNINTNWSNINANGIWSMEPNFTRRTNKLYLLLNNNRTKKIHAFEIPANDEVYNKLYFRNDRNVYRLLFNVSDLNFIETLKDINFKKFYKGFIEY